MSIKKDVRIGGQRLHVLTASEINKLPGVKRVEVIGNQTLIEADCISVMPLLGQFDAVVTDPPYGIGAANGSNDRGADASGRYRRKPRQYEGRWDDARPSRQSIEATVSAANLHIVWGGNFFSDWLPVGGRWLIWDKLNSMPSFSDAELAWTSIKGASVKKFTQCANGPSANRDGRVHPTQKPLALMDWCLGFLPEAKTILDPFAGSGTTAVACERMGRQCTAIELDPDYFEIMCRRVDEQVRQPDMFVASPPPSPKQEAFNV